MSVDPFVHHLFYTPALAKFGHLTSEALPYIAFSAPTDECPERGQKLEPHAQKVET